MGVPITKKPDHLKDSRTRPKRLSCTLVGGVIALSRDFLFQWRDGWLALPLIVSHALFMILKSLSSQHLLKLIVFGQIQCLNVLWVKIRSGK